MQLLDRIRKLAKTNHYQALYSNISNLDNPLFKNNVNFTILQIIFLNYLRFYQSLLEDIAVNEVNKKVLDDVIYENAYIYYKKHKHKEPAQLQNETPNTDPNKFINKWGISFKKGAIKES